MDGRPWGESIFPPHPLGLQFGHTRGSVRSGAAVTGGLKHRAPRGPHSHPTNLQGPIGRARTPGLGEPGSKSSPARSVQEVRGCLSSPVTAMPRLAAPAYQLKRSRTTSGTVEESSKKWNFGVGLRSLPSASQVLMSSRSTAARSIPRMPMAMALRGSEGARDCRQPLGKGTGCGQCGERGSWGVARSRL